MFVQERSKGVCPGLGSAMLGHLLLAGHALSCFLPRRPRCIHGLALLRLVRKATRRTSVEASVLDIAKMEPVW